MRLLFSVIAMLIFGTTAVQIYKLENKKNSLEQEFSKIKEKVDALELENSSIEKDITYFKNPKNLEKEARAQFNYALPGEKLIILVPKSQ